MALETWLNDVQMGKKIGMHLGFHPITTVDCGVCPTFPKNWAGLLTMYSKNRKMGIEKWSKKCDVIKLVPFFVRLTILVGGGKKKEPVHKA